MNFNSQLDFGKVNQSFIRKIPPYPFIELKLNKPPNLEPNIEEFPSGLF